MRTNVTFRHPAEFVPLSEDDGILAVSGANWFGALLGRVPGLVIDDNACQEDWGVVFFVRHNQVKFWIGLSAWDETGKWLAHFHYGSFAWLRWLVTYRSTSPQRAEKILDSRGGEFGPRLSIVLYRQAEQMAAGFRDSPASGTRDLRNQLAVVQAFDQAADSGTLLAGSRRGVAE